MVMEQRQGEEFGVNACQRNSTQACERTLHKNINTHTWTPNFPCVAPINELCGLLITQRVFMSTNTACLRSAL